MTKHDFIAFISEQLKDGGVRFSLAFNSKGEIVIHWTNAKGLRVWRVLTGNKGNKPSATNQKRMHNFRRWLVDARKGIEGATPYT